MTSPDSLEAEDHRYHVIRAGFTGDVEAVTSGLSHNDSTVRATSLRALARIGKLQHNELTRALQDTDHEVRRCAAELSATFHDVNLCALLHDEDVFVAEMAAWAMGEREHPSDDDINTLINAVHNHAEPLVREAATAALGSLGDSRGLAAILHACNDKPAIRRRAVLALAPFEGDEVTAALQTALEDRDWQVRQNAEDMLHPRGY